MKKQIIDNRVRYDILGMMLDLKEMSGCLYGFYGQSLTYIERRMFVETKIVPKAKLFAERYFTLDGSIRLDWLDCDDWERTKDYYGIIATMTANIEFYLLSIDQSAREIFIKRLSFYLHIDYYFTLYDCTYSEIDEFFVECEIKEEHKNIVLNIADLLFHLTHSIDKMIRFFNKEGLVPKDTHEEVGIDKLITCSNKELARDMIKTYLKGMVGKSVSIAIQALIKAKILAPTSNYSRVKLYRNIAGFTGFNIGSDPSINKFMFDNSITDITDEIKSLTKQIVEDYKAKGGK